jgi:hypothetical protein
LTPLDKLSRKLRTLVDCVNICCFLFLRSYAHAERAGDEPHPADRREAQPVGAAVPGLFLPGARPALLTAATLSALALVAAVAVAVSARRRTRTAGPAA